MRGYQEEYLSLLDRAASLTSPPPEELTPDQFVEAAARAADLSDRLVKKGTELLRGYLFPVLDNILSATAGEIGDLLEFSSKIMNRDVGLHYRITLALVTYARRKGDRDLLIRELYEMGMALHNMQNMLSPREVRVYSTRMRMAFAECASHFETDYDEITDPETRGYIHRSMGNITLCYDTKDERSAMKKLEACTRSIRILSDPDVRAKTPSLPWDRFLYTSHQQRTALLSYLRSGNPDHQVFAQVLESAQIVQEQQIRQLRERGEPLLPRWQYAYLAALYHSGALHITQLLDGIYGLCSACADDDFSTKSSFSHVAAPAYYMLYTEDLPDHKLDGEVASRIARLTDRMFRWLARAPGVRGDNSMMFSVRQFLYVYKELPGCMPYTEVLLNVFALLQPASYLRQWIAGKIARLITGWAVDDTAPRMAGILGTRDADDVRARRDEILSFAEMAGNLYDVGMIHFVNIESSACRGVFEEEGELLKLHTHCGTEILGSRPSTAPYADIARGHHMHFDGKGGYPVDFSIQDSPVRAVICAVAAADALASTIPETSSRYRPVKPLSLVLEDLRRDAGTVYSPTVVGLLTPDRLETLRRSLQEWRKQAVLDMYRRREHFRET